jgi:hypothetical protein
LVRRLAQLESLLERITTQAKSFVWQRHPIFGRMSEAAWLRWAYLHMDHHSAASARSGGSESREYPLVNCPDTRRRPFERLDERLRR